MDHSAWEFKAVDSKARCSCEHTLLLVCFFGVWSFSEWLLIYIHWLVSIRNGTEKDRGNGLQICRILPSISVEWGTCEQVSFFLREDPFIDKLCLNICISVISRRGWRRGGRRGWLQWDHLGCWLKEAMLIRFIERLMWRTVLLCPSAASLPLFPSLFMDFLHTLWHCLTEGAVFTPDLDLCTPSQLRSHSFNTTCFKRPSCPAPHTNTRIHTQYHRIRIVDIPGDALTVPHLFCLSGPCMCSKTNYESSQFEDKCELYVSCSFN